ncbi:MAG: hypothetical protein AB1796_09640 [Bacillota bacterium]
MISTNRNGAFARGAAALDLRRRAVSAADTLKQGERYTAPGLLTYLGG